MHSFLLICPILLVQSTEALSEEHGTHCYWSRILRGKPLYNANHSITSFCSANNSLPLWPLRRQVQKSTHLWYCSCMSLQRGLLVDTELKCNTCLERCKRQGTSLSSSSDVHLCDKDLITWARNWIFVRLYLTMPLTIIEEVMTIALIFYLLEKVDLINYL